MHACRLRTGPTSHVCMFDRGIITALINRRVSYMHAHMHDRFLQLIHRSDVLLFVFLRRLPNYLGYYCICLYAWTPITNVWRMYVCFFLKKKRMTYAWDGTWRHIRSENWKWVFMMCPSRHLSSQGRLTSVVNWSDLQSNKKKIIPDTRHSKNNMGYFNLSLSQFFFKFH